MKLTIWYDNQLRATVVYNVSELLTNYNGDITVWCSDGTKFQYPKPLFMAMTTAGG